MNDDGSGLFDFGMTPQQVHQKCVDLGWSCKPESGIDENGDIRTGSAFFSFTDGKMDSLGASYSDFQTERGFAGGDSREKLVKLYGKNYQYASMDDATDDYLFTLPGGIQLDVTFLYKQDKANYWTIAAPGTIWLPQ